MFLAYYFYLYIFIRVCPSVGWAVAFVCSLIRQFLLKCTKLHSVLKKYIWHLTFDHYSFGLVLPHLAARWIRRTIQCTIASLLAYTWWFTYNETWNKHLSLPNFQNRYLKPDPLTWWWLSWGWCALGSADKHRSSFWKKNCKILDKHCFHKISDVFSISKGPMP